VTSKQRLFLRSFAVWTVWVWGTRIWNVIGDDSRGAGVKAVHIVLALVSVAFAVGTWIVTTRTAAREPVASA
jgi:hypothetical protein